MSRFEDDSELEEIIRDQHVTFKGMSQLAAERRYIDELKAAVPYYGSSFFAAKVMVQQTDDDDERTEPHPAIAVSMNGIYVLTGWNLSEQDFFDYETITSGL